MSIFYGVSQEKIEDIVANLLQGATYDDELGTITINSIPRGHIDGLILSNNGDDAANDIDIAVGSARSADDAIFMRLTSALTKQANATWASGDDAGGMAEGESLAEGTVHVFLLSTATGGSVDVGFDTDPDATNLLADTAVVAASLTKYRRIGSLTVNSDPAFIAFSQRGDKFLLDVPVQDENNTNPGTNAITPALSVPSGIQVDACFSFYLRDGTPVGIAYLVTSPDQADTDPGATVDDGNTTVDGENIATRMTIRTNTSGQIRYRLSGSAGTARVEITTHGWIDSRGKE